MSYYMTVREKIDNVELLLGLGYTVEEVTKELGYQWQFVSNVWAALEKKERNEKNETACSSGKTLLTE